MEHAVVTNPAHAIISSAKLTSYSNHLNGNQANAMMALTIYVYPGNHQGLE